MYATVICPKPTVGYNQVSSSASSCMALVILFVKGRGRRGNAGGSVPPQASAPGSIANPAAIVDDFMAIRGALETRNAIGWLLLAGRLSKID